MNKAAEAYSLLGSAQVASGALPYNRRADTMQQYASAPANWAALIPPATGREQRKTRSIGLNYVLPAMAELVQRTGAQACQVANKLRTGNPKVDAYRVWHWLKTNVGRFALDAPGSEQLRSFSRSWADRGTGVDCDDWSIAAASLLQCMGYPTQFEVVAFANGHFSHVYLTTGPYVIDVNMDGFNKEASGITDRISHPVTTGKPQTTMSGIGTYTLTGIDNVTVSGCGCSGVNARQASGPIRKYSQPAWGNVPYRPSDVIAKEARKLAWANSVMLDDPRMQAPVKSVLPLLDDIGVDGKLIPIVPDGLTPQEAEEGILAVLAANFAKAEQSVAGLAGLGAVGYELEEALSGLGAAMVEIEIDEDDIDLALSGLSGKKKKRLQIGKKIKATVKRVTKKIGPAIKKVTTAVKKGVKTGLKAVGNGIKKAVAFIKKVNPLSVVARNAYLALLALNFRGMASFAARNGDINEGAKKRWKQLGGDPNKLQAAINKGKGKKPLLGQSKKRKIAVRTATGRAGLGAEPVTTASIVGLASGVLAAMAAFFKSKGHRDPTEAEGTDPADANILDTVQEFVGPFIGPGGQNPNPEGAIEEGGAFGPTDGGGNNDAFNPSNTDGGGGGGNDGTNPEKKPLPIVPIAIGAALLLFLLK